MNVRGLVTLATILLACTVISLNINCTESSGGSSSSEDGTTCTDADNDGYFAQAGCGTTVDCDDSIANVWNDCVDGDGDGYETGAACDDTNPSIYPGNTIACGDCIDNDGDGLTDMEDTESLLSG